MAEMCITDPDEYRAEIPVDDRGRVVVGKQYAGKKVNVTVEVVEE